MKRPIDWSLYLITDRGLSLGRPLEMIIREAVAGGVTAVQLREKEASSREFIDLARRAREIVRPIGIPLIINDRADVALAVEADGLHIGQSDLPYADARRIVGPEAVIGLSADTAQQARVAEALDVDYVGVGPIFATRTKTDAGPPWSCERLRRLRPDSRHVLIAVGGINETNAAEVIRAGADGIAVVSALCSAPDVRAAARRLRDIIEAARSGAPPRGTRR